MRVHGHCSILSSCDPSHFTLTAALGGGGHYTHFTERRPGPKTTGWGTRCPDPVLFHPHSALARGSESGPLGLLALARWSLCHGYAVNAREHWCQGCSVEWPVSGQALALGLRRPFQAQHVQTPPAVGVGCLEGLRDAVLLEGPESPVLHSLCRSLAASGPQRVHL